MKHSIYFWLLFLWSAQAFSQTCTANQSIAYQYPGPGMATVFAWPETDTLNGSPVPVSFLWNTGSNATSITTTVAGNFCVTITYDNGCAGTSCINVADPATPAGGDTCYVSLSVTGTIITAHPSPNEFSPDWQFQWDTLAGGSATTPYVLGNYGETYCVTVTNTVTGCTASQCTTLVAPSPLDVWINQFNGTLFTNVSGGMPPYQYQWSTGLTTSQIQVTAPGSYCVTITDAAGSTASNCYIYTPSGTCSVQLQQFDNGEVLAQANIQGGTTYPTFEWSIPGLPNQQWIYAGLNWSTLCVTMTTSYGCTATACINNAYENECLWSIQCKSFRDGTAKLIALVPDPAATILWSTGETNDTIQITGTGTYAVSVTAANGCTSVKSIDIYGNYDFWVNLGVTNPNGTISSGSVYQFDADIFIINYVPDQGGILTATATEHWTPDDDHLLITGLPAGTYLLKAALRPEDPQYADYLPTYCTNSLLWSGGKMFTLPRLTPYPSASWGPLIGLVPGQNPGGPGFIGGLVIEGANLTGNGAGNRGEGDPMAGVTVLLFTTDSIPVAASVSDSEGKYQFANLPFGTYRLYTDVPGLAPTFIIVTIGPGQPSVTNAIIETGANATTSTGPTIAHSKPVILYPNPVSDQFVLEGLTPGAAIILRTAAGTPVHAQEAHSSRETIAVQHLPAGYYLVEIKENGRTRYGKFVKG